MKAIYIVRYNDGRHHYFGTLKKAHAFCLANKLNVMRHFSEFKRWFIHFGYIDLGQDTGDVIKADVL